MPFYKWVFRGMHDLPLLSDFGDVLAFLIESGNTVREKEAKLGIIKDVSRAVLAELSSQGLIRGGGDDLEHFAYEVNSKIKDANLRNESIFSGMIRE